MARPPVLGELNKTVRVRTAFLFLGTFMAVVEKEGGDIFVAPYNVERAFPL